MTHTTKEHLTVPAALTVLYLVFTRPLYPTPRYVAFWAAGALVVFGLTWAGQTLWRARRRRKEGTRCQRRY